MAPTMGMRFCAVLKGLALLELEFQKPKALTELDC